MVDDRGGRLFRVLGELELEFLQDFAAPLFHADYLRLSAVIEDALERCFEICSLGWRLRNQAHVRCHFFDPVARLNLLLAEVVDELVDLLISGVSGEAAEVVMLDGKWLELVERFERFPAGRVGGEIADDLNAFVELTDYVFLGGEDRPRDLVDDALEVRFYELLRLVVEVVLVDDALEFLGCHSCNSKLFLQKLLLFDHLQDLVRQVVLAQDRLLKF